MAALEERRSGWQTSMTGAVIVRPPALVQTVTASAAGQLDTAWCVPAALDSGSVGYRVKHITTVGARRVTLPRIGSGVLVVARGGSFERWKLTIGDHLEVRGE